MRLNKSLEALWAAVTPIALAIFPKSFSVETAKSMSCWPLLSSGDRAKMTVGCQPCPWLVAEDIPCERLQPLAGMASFGCGWGELDPAVSPIQMGTLHQGSRTEKKASVTIGLRLLRWPLFFIDIGEHKKILIRCQYISIDMHKFFVIAYMAEWIFRDYERLSTGGETPVLVNEILAWTLGLPKTAQAKIDARILVLGGWPGVWPAQYVSDCGFPDIWELRVGSGGVQYRPLGFYGPQRREFTLVIGTIEKGGRIPAGDGASAVERRTRVLQGWPTREHQFATV